MIVLYIKFQSEKESLLILKMKPCLNIVQESMLLYLFDNDS